VIAILRCLRVAVPLALTCWANTARAEAAPDSTIYTTYSVDATYQHLSYVVCGSTQNGDEGCYASGLLGSFGHVGAMLEDAPVITGDTVTRRIYVLDIADGPARDVVALSVYAKTDLVTDAFDTVTIKSDRKFELPLVGGRTVTPFMAGNAGYLFVGTNKSDQAVILNKHDFPTFTTIGEGTPLVYVAAINADTNGFVIVTFSGRLGGFYVFGPNGEWTSEGGGQELVLNNYNAVTPQPIEQ
jgi:hypothetical protein